MPLKELVLLALSLTLWMRSGTAVRPKEGITVTEMLVKPLTPTSKRDGDRSRTAVITAAAQKDPRSGGASEACPVKVNPARDTLVKCQCLGDQVLTDDGECKDYPEGTFIEAERGHRRKTSSYNVSVIKDFSCGGNAHRLLQFDEGQFQLRIRGDIKLTSAAGVLHGQRIGNYCISHHFSINGTLTFSMKGCVAVPAVPRCCPSGQAVKEGSCQQAPTPDLLEPPISADLDDLVGVNWPKITNFLSSVPTCKSQYLKTYPLSWKRVHLFSLASGVILRFTTPGFFQQNLYIYSPDYCVDGINDARGNTTYFISFCYNTPEEQHEVSCAGEPCVRKCCDTCKMLLKKGECVDTLSNDFHPLTENDASLYNTVIGWPLCSLEDLVTNIGTIDDQGYLTYKGVKHDPTRYCVDAKKQNDSLVQAAMVCPPLPSNWERVKQVLFPLCDLISCFFLAICIFFHIKVPQMMKSGGVHQFCHIIGLAAAYFVSFCGSVFNKFLTEGSGICLAFAFILQFSFLTAFFWLNVMCFEVWRITRCLNSFTMTYKSCPLWSYMVYAYGIPVLISIATMTIEFLPAAYTEGLIKPTFAVTKCFFHGDMGLLAYFYGPIAVLFLSNLIFLCLTFDDYRKLRKKYKENVQYLRERNVAHSPSNAMKNAKQVNDHFPEFTQRLSIFVLFTLCWTAEILSWVIPPPELWALTDVLNSLQGVFIFAILLGNRNKRNLIRRAFPGAFRTASRILCCKHSDGMISGDELETSERDISLTKQTLGSGSQEDLQRDMTRQASHGVADNSDTESPQVSSRNNYGAT